MKTSCGPLGTTTWRILVPQDWNKGYTCDVTVCQCCHNHFPELQITTLLSVHSQKRRGWTKTNKQQL